MVLDKSWGSGFLGKCFPTLGPLFSQDQRAETGPGSDSSSGKKAKPLSWAESELWKLGTVGPSRGAAEQGVGSWVLSLAWDLVLTPAETPCFLRDEASSGEILWGCSMLGTGLSAAESSSPCFPVE